MTAVNWKYALKRALGNRFALTAALFLAITLWGSVTVLLGTLNERAACEGYAVPYATARPQKLDPTRPRRVMDSPAADLGAYLPDRLPGSDAGEKAAAAEAQVTKALEDQHGLIQLYGAFQRFIDRTVVEDAASPQYAVVRLPDDSLTFVGEGDPDPRAQAAQLKRLQTALAERDIGFFYAQAPSKLEPGAEVLPYGVDDPSNACADALMEQLEALDIDHLDLRETLRESGGEWTDWFYQTDHHWTQNAAFSAFQAMAGQLEEYDQTLPAAGGTKRRTISIDPKLTAPASYNVDTLPRFFLGSQGKRVGSLYAGADDFELWTPKFPSLLHYDARPQYNRFGDAGETVLFPERVEDKDWFGGNPYTYYAGGDYGYAHITNYYDPDGPKILLIRDSFACAVTPYLALASSQLTTIDPRSFYGDLLGYVDRLQPDVVVVLYSSGMVRSEQYYRLLAQPRRTKTDSLRWELARAEQAKS